MTLDELILAARLTVRETVVLHEMLQARGKPVPLQDLIDAIKRNILVNPKESGKFRYSPTGKPLTLTGNNIRYTINSLNSKLLQANTGYAVVKTSGRGRGAHGVYRLRNPVFSKPKQEKEHQHA